MIHAALALIVWTLIIWWALYLQRIPAVRKARLSWEAMKEKNALDVLPTHERWVTQNYNHLHEQPTLFYALIFYAQFAGHDTAFLIWLAWGYVILRIAHSLVQVTTNSIKYRFTIFALASLVLMTFAAINVVLALT